MWVKHAEDTRLPEWLSSNLRSNCSCGFPIENYYNEGMQCTARRCTNPKCPEVLAQKISSMCDILQIKGVAEGIGRRLVSEHALTSHFGAVPYLFTEKPKLPLATFMRIIFIPGIDTRWGSICGEYSSIDELYENTTSDIKRIIDDYKSDIDEGLKYIDIMESEAYEYEPVITGTVMISGSIRGLQERDSFIYGLNKMSKGLIRLSVSKSKRKTGVMCLIQEADQPNRGKAECAIENGIPIMTPEQFRDYIMDLLQKRLAERMVKA